MGRRLAAVGMSPDLIICSPAKRAFTTASLLAKELGYPRDAIVKNDQLYFDGVSAMLEIIHQTDSDINSLMLVGHNPDMTSMFNNLCGYQTNNMKTSGIARIEFDLHWSGIQSKSGHLAEYDYPKKPIEP